MQGLVQKLPFGTVVSVKVPPVSKIIARKSYFVTGSKFSKFTPITPSSSLVIFIVPFDENTGHQKFAYNTVRLF